MIDSKLAVYISDIIEAAETAISYVQELSYSELLADKRTQQAIALNFIIIGECSGKIMDRYPEFVAKHPEIQWIKMRGMRNQVAHAYSDINLDVVWDTVQTSLLKLISKLNEQS